MSRGKLEMPSCIYCGANADGTEHWLPRLLGTFGKLQILHDTVSKPCNGAVGKVEQEFIRTGPEGIQRQGLGIEGRDGPGGDPVNARRGLPQPPLGDLGLWADSR
jgi:hypothetical protein